MSVQSNHASSASTGSQRLRVATTARSLTMDQYLAATPDDQRAALESLRKTIHQVAPDADESISYGLPAFRLNGRPLIAFGVARHHCAFYPMSPAVLAAHREELGEFSTSKGAIRFQPAKPLPFGLVRRLVKARIHEIEMQHPGAGVKGAAERSK